MLVISGLSAYDQTTDWACTSTYCFGLNAVATEDYKTLQRNLNALASVLSISLLPAINGNIDQATAEAAYAAARMYRDTATGDAAQAYDAILTNTTRTKELIATHAFAINGDLVLRIQAGFDQVATPATPATPAALVPTAQVDQPRSGGTWIWWVIGSAAVVGICVLSYAARRPRHMACLT
jgi:hypothetical protein